jgi:hypothetical protein
VWCTKYKPAAFRRYSRKWVKIKKRMDGLPKRWYLVTAIRKDALLDDERDQHLSAEEVVEKVPEKSAAELLEESRWLPPQFDYRKKKLLKEQYVNNAEHEEEKERKRRETQRRSRMTKMAMEKEKAQAIREALEEGGEGEGGGEEEGGEEGSKEIKGESEEKEEREIVPDVSELKVSE